jgi:Na+-translocating ferredoxin:NAD+ oxidoreductase RnfE subunit
MHSSTDVDSIQHWIGLAVPAALAGPASVAVALSGTFVHWIAKVYQNMCVLIPIVVGDCDEISRPETLRCFMAYIVDLTLVLDRAFGMVHLKPTPKALDEIMLDIAVRGYTDTCIGDVHYEIRCYASQSGVLKASKDRLQEGMRGLVGKFCTHGEAQGARSRNNVSPNSCLSSAAPPS